MQETRFKHIIFTCSACTEVMSGLGMQEGTDQIVRGVREGGRLVWLADRTLKVLPLPVLAAANGHVAFVQHLPERYR